MAFGCSIAKIVGEQQRSRVEIMDPRRSFHLTCFISQLKWVVGILATLKRGSSTAALSFSGAVPWIAQLSITHELPIYKSFRLIFLQKSIKTNDFNFL